MSDNEEVRRDLVRQANPNKLTTFFYERPCISIWTPYILLVIFSSIVFAGDVFKLDFMDDSWLVNDDIMVINRDMTNVAKWSLKRSEAGIDAKKEEMEKTQVRFDTDGMKAILVMYEDKSENVGGLLSKDTMMKVIELEHDLTSWNKKSKSFKNKEFNDKADVSWDSICFAGRDADIDKRNNKAKCLPNRSYVSAINLFTDNWKDCHKSRICDLTFGLGGEAALAALEAGSLEDEQKAFREFFKNNIKEKDVISLL
jgi:hypothetical protein